jgi:hypothetical protein
MARIDIDKLVWIGGMVARLFKKSKRARKIKALMSIAAYAVEIVRDPSFKATRHRIEKAWEGGGGKLQLTAADVSNLGRLLTTLDDLEDELKNPTVPRRG